MDVQIEDSWKQVLQSEFDKPYFELLTSFVRREYAAKQCFPPGPLIFNAFNSCPFAQVRVVIIGQDPYHDVGQAHGLCFSVNEGVAIPPSLENIYKELNRDLGKPIPNTGNLQHWANQGVLLLNATLTVEAHHPGSHQNKGWEELTDAAIMALSQQREHIVYMLWGSYAQRKGQIIDRRKNLVLTAPHPSPLSAYRGFIGCGHFSAANAYLVQHGLSPIEW
ncbi:MAG: uracil-DNA glycosylase [Paludibacteraceae bacterium]|nr:uracil-DNA glycosylase [Paludibacteraceae bacterium]